MTLDANGLIEIFQQNDINEFDRRGIDVSIYILSDEYVGSLLSQEHEIFNKNPTILQAAAFFKANNILESLMAIDDHLFNKKDKGGRTVNHFAAAGGNLEYFQKNEKLYDFMETDDRSWTIFHYAANYNHPEILRWGIKINLPPDNKSQDGTPLRLACQNCFLRCIEVLCTSRKVQENLRKPMANSILLSCLNNRLYEAIPFLMDAGMELEKQQFDNWPLLFFGAISNSPSIPQELLRRGVNVDMEDNLHWTALFAAVSRRRMHNVRFLLENNANPFHMTGVNFTVFNMANVFHPEDPNRECAKIVREYIRKRITRYIVDKIIKSYYK